MIAAGFDKATNTKAPTEPSHYHRCRTRLIRNLAALNHHTILAITAGGNVDMNPWIDRIPALLYLWYPGEEGGAALADILFGVQNPEGKLPDTFETKWEDNPTFHSYYPQPTTQTPRRAPHIHYSEGVFLGYRYFNTPSVDTASMQPRFPFGFGLSYTTFPSAIFISAVPPSADDPSPPRSPFVILARSQEPMSRRSTSANNILRFPGRAMSSKRSRRFVSRPVKAAPSLCR